MNVPTGYTALDLVGFTDKGNYNSNTYYVQNDLVHDAGNIWRCLIDDTHGITPTEGANWTIFIAEPTDMAEAIIAPIEYSPATAAHSAGDQLIYNDTLYKVIAAIAIGDSLTVGTNIQAARKIVYQISATESIIAGIEYTTTASQAYSAGDYLLYDWTLYKVTASIASGGAIITTGGSANVSATTIGQELVSLNSHIANLQTEDSNIKATMRSNGAHNFLPIIKANCKAVNTAGTWSGDVFTPKNQDQTDQDLHITLTDDGVILDGTCEANYGFRLDYGNSYVSALRGDYVLSVSGKTMPANTYLTAAKSDEINQFVISPGEKSADMSLTDALHLFGTVTFYIMAGATFSNDEYKPMITSASDTDTTYAPYAMTNRELTEKFYTYSMTVPAAGTAISLPLPYGTRDDWILSGTTLEYTPWGAAYDVYSAAIVFGVTTVLHNQYLEIGNGYTSGTHNKDAAGQNIRVLLVHK